MLTSAPIPFYDIDNRYHYNLIIHEASCHVNNENDNFLVILHKFLHIRMQGRKAPYYAGLPIFLLLAVHNQVSDFTEEDVCPCDSDIKSLRLLCPDWTFFQV